MHKLAFKVKSLFIKENTLRQEKLIEELIKEHEELFKLYTQIKNEENPQKKLNLLQKFYYDYRLHILKEEKHLYSHLLVKYKFVPEKLEFIKEKQKEINQITEFVEDFAKKYSTLESLQNEDFPKDLDKLGEELTKRVEFEEMELYSLY